MYGKTLADFPERFDEFLEEFKTADPDRLNQAFERARGHCEQFPTPADIRKLYDKIPVDVLQVQAGYERLKQRLAAQPEVKQLKSVLDEPKRPTREVTQLSEAEVKARLEFLAGQKIKLLEELDGKK